MESTHLMLLPNESIRTPKVLFMNWMGKDRMHGHNQFRQFLLKNYIPRRNGDLFNLPFACSGCRGQKLGDEANNFTEANQLEFIDEFLRYNIEYLWIDAGWYEGKWPNGVGNWIIRKDGFPNGFRPITDYLKKLGIGFVLWFEPERVHNGTWIYQNHPEWLLKSKGSNHLLNLGNKEALIG
jgi:alpha-galactosidase